MKRQAVPIKKENFHSVLVFGDMAHLPLDQLTTLVDAVSMLR